MERATATKLTQVLIADDHELVRSGIRQALSLAGDIEVVAEASDGQRALVLLAEQDVDVVLLDLRMPCMDGLTCLEEIRTRWPDLPVIMLSVEDSREVALDSLRRGAAGYVVKTIRPGDLASMVRSAAEGNVYMGGPDVATATAGPEADPHGLTSREREILRLLADGLSNDEIARRVFLTPKTVKYHLTHVYTKLGVSNRTEAAAFALKNGLAD